MINSPILSLQEMIQLDIVREIANAPEIKSGMYFIDRYSNVFSNSYNRYPLLATTIKENGYVAVSLQGSNGSRIQRKVHRLAMLTYCYFPGCELYEVNHNDGNKLNNHLSNLEWNTPKQNVRHAIDNNLRASWSCQNNPKAKLTIDDVQNICNLIINGSSNSYISSLYNISNSEINGIISGRQWSNIISNEQIYLMRKAKFPDRLTDKEKHSICEYFQNSNFKKSLKGDVRNFIISALQYNNIPITESHITQSKRLYYRYQDDDITSMYKY